MPFIIYEREETHAVFTDFSVLFKVHFQLWETVCALFTHLHFSESLSLSVFLFHLLYLTIIGHCDLLSSFICFIFLRCRITYFPDNDQHSFIQNFQLLSKLLLLTPSSLCFLLSIELMWLWGFAYLEPR